MGGGSQPPARVRRKKLEERGSHLPFRHGLLRDGPVVPRDSVRAGVEALLFEVPGREGAGGGRDIEGWPKEKGGHGTRRSIDRSIASSPLELLHLKASASFPEYRACGPHVVHHHALGLQVALSGHELFVRDRLGVARKGDGGRERRRISGRSGRRTRARREKKLAKAHLIVARGRDRGTKPSKAPRAVPRRAREVAREEGAPAGNPAAHHPRRPHHRRTPRRRKASSGAPSLSPTRLRVADTDRASTPPPPPPSEFFFFFLFGAPHPTLLSSRCGSL